MVCCEYAYAARVSLCLFFLYTDCDQDENEAITRTVLRRASDGSQRNVFQQESDKV